MVPCSTDSEDPNFRLGAAQFNKGVGVLMIGREVVALIGGTFIMMYVMKGKAMGLRARVKELRGRLAAEGKTAATKVPAPAPAPGVKATPPTNCNAEMLKSASAELSTLPKLVSGKALLTFGRGTLAGGGFLVSSHLIQNGHQRRGNELAMFIAAVGLSRGGGFAAVPFAARRAFLAVGGLVFLINLKERVWGDAEN